MYEIRGKNFCIGVTEASSINFVNINISNHSRWLNCASQTEGSEKCMQRLSYISNAST